MKKSASSRPSVAVLHAATAVANGGQGRLVSDEAAGLEQRCGVSVGLGGNDGYDHHPRRGGSVGVLDSG